MPRSARPELFRTVPTGNPLGFWVDGQLRPRAVADFLSLTRADIAEVTALAPSSVRFDHKMPREILGRLSEIAALCEVVAEHFHGNAARTELWFRTANPLLGNLAPRDMIRNGRMEHLRQFVIEAATSGGTNDSRTPSEERAAGLSAYKADLERLCRQFGVRSLAAFGSVTRPDFDLARSDIDLAVEFAELTELSPARQYFEFKQALEALFGRPVDLVELSAMEPSRLKRIIERSQVPLYAEAA
ncbi:MAG: nucleotidyltransferase domain-containing protein [Proteobacteria bacterium]|nr:nucleotidyltransferase domain-containing protein [Pseudomonadota bacterium]